MELQVLTPFQQHIAHMLVRKAPNLYLFHLQLSNEIDLL
jgi:hypothetical protein